MQRVISALINLVPQRVKLRLIGKPEQPLGIANAVHSILNRLPGRTFTVLPCKGPLDGYRMKIDWRRNRSYIYGTWEPDVVGVLRQYVSPGMVAFDVGAYGGFYTLLLKKLVGTTGRVVSFEPIMANFQLLEENIALNECSNVLAVNKAVGERSAQMLMAVQGSDSSLMSSEFGAKNGKAKQSVEVISVDEFVAEANLPVHVMKMDVEGAEAAVLRGARKTIQSYHPVMVIELHEFDRYGESHPAIAELSRWGYQIEWLNKWKGTAHILAK